MPASPNYISNDTINPSTIVGMDSIDFKVKSVTSDTIKVIGVMQDGTHLPPGVTGSTGEAAVPGQSVQVFGEDEECLVMSATTITVGNRLKATTGGKATPVLGTETYTVTSPGYALEGCTAANTLIRMYVNLAEINHPLA